MKIQNLSIIFLIIVIPLILILSYYLNLQQDTLKLQAEYDTKLAGATKEGVKAFEVNTVDWSEWVSEKTRATERSDVSAAINTVITGLANNLNVSGTAKEYMVNYIPAIAVTMYDGYYIYAPNYVPVTMEDENGVQYYCYNDGSKDVLTTNSNNGENLPAYKKKDGGKINNNYIKDDGSIVTKLGDEFVTEIENAEMEYKHTLSTQIAYVERYEKGNNTNVVVNYTLDNRIYVYGMVNGASIQKDGYLVYFGRDTKLPRITIDLSKKNENAIGVEENFEIICYDNGEFTTNIEAEILEEQVLYYDGSNYKLDTFKYVYDISHNKLYYDEGENDFFTIEPSSKEKQYIEDNPIKYKSVSVLLGNEDTTEYKKLYMPLNGKDKGTWCINLKGDPEGSEVIDTRIKDSTILQALGLENGNRPENLFKDYSAISYYVEAYAFTNWIGEDDNLGEIKVEVEGTTEKIFKITKTNNPEKEGSPIVVHKEQVMKENIITNLNLSISNYSMGTYEFKLPVLTDNDWNQVFSNISIITFLQGMPIGLKQYNNYAIATSTTNREYVDPEEIYFSGEDDTSYHKANCEKCGNAKYTGYRSVEYALKEFVKYDDTDSENILAQLYYYQHDNKRDTNSETACYYCLVNRANYKATEESEEPEKVKKQNQAYNEALARERYYQKEEIQAKMNITITYDPGLTEGGYIEEIININPNTREAEPGESINLTRDTPEVRTTIGTVWEFIGWEDKNTNIVYDSGALASFEKDVILYAKWQPRIDSLNWKEDFITQISTISRMNNDVSMVGNPDDQGKGAIWLNWQYYGIDIVELSFDYDITFGDSFSAAGILLNVEDTNPDNPHEGQLKGIMLSFNCLESQTDMSSFFKKTGSIANLWEKFTYNKGKWTERFIESDLAGGYCKDLNIAKTGHITIKVTNSGYEIDVNGTKHNIDLGGIPANQNSIGFFSDHGDHSCPETGSFIIKNVNAKVEVNE